MNDRMMEEIQYWSEVQEQRGCNGCLFFDTTRIGKDSFCTYAFKLDVEQKDGKETCHTRRERVVSLYFKEE